MMCQGNVETIDWYTIMLNIRAIFTGVDVTFITCNNAIEMPPIEKRKDIIAKNHDSASGSQRNYKNIP